MIFIFNLFLATFLNAVNVYLELYTKVSKKVVIGVSEVIGNVPMKQDFRFRIIDNLLDSGLFSVETLGPDATKKDFFKVWKLIGAEVILQTSILESNKLFNIKYTLYDSGGKAIVEGSFLVNKDEVIFTANRIVDEIIRFLFGIKGIYSSKIAFVNDRTGSKEVYVINFDGSGLKQLTFDGGVKLTPRFIDENKLAFMSIRGNPPKSRIEVVELDGRRYTLTSYPGLNSTPRFFSNGSFIATLSIDGYPHLYLLNSEGRVIKQLTKGSFSDTSAAISPGGRLIAFTSDRSGTPQIYVMGIDGTDLRRITPQGYADSPSFSPDGMLLAFSFRPPFENKFQIYIADVITGTIIRLTDEGGNENPVFASDGRKILFVSDRNGKKELFIMNLDGSNQKRLFELPGNILTPDIYIK